MIRILTKQEAKKYMHGVSELFRVKREVADIKLDAESKAEFNLIMKKIKEGSLYETEPIKKEIVKRRFLEGESFSEIAEEVNYSQTHVYTLYREIIKDFTMVIFRVVIL